MSVVCGSNGLLEEVVEECDCIAAEMAVNAEPIKVEPLEDRDDDPTIEQSLYNGDPLPEMIEGPQDFNNAIAEAYKEDTLLKHIISNLSEHPQFVIINRLIYTHNLSNKMVMAIPKPTTGKSFYQIRTQGSGSIRSSKDIRVC